MFTLCTEKSGGNRRFLIINEISVSECMDQNNGGGVQHQIKSKAGPLRTYQQAVLGSPSLFKLIVYELNECFITPLPGRIGQLLRSFFYPFIFQSYARSSKIGKNLTIYQPSKILVEAGVEVAENVTFNVKSGGEGIILQKGVKIGEKCILSCPGGTINIGRETKIGKNCRLGSLMGLKIGHNCRIGSNSYIIGAAHSYNSVDVPIIQQPLTCRGKTIIGSHVNIGTGVTIRDGIIIGDNAQIADDSLVLDNVPRDNFVKGVPAVRS